MHGYVFAALGGLFTFVCLGGYLLQLVIGEAMFQVEGPGLRARRPLGQEFVFMFFAVGQVFMFVGLALVAGSRKGRVVRFALAIGNVAVALAALATVIATASGWATSA